MEIQLPEEHEKQGNIRKEVEDYKTLLRSLIENVGRPLVDTSGKPQLIFPYWPVEPDSEVLNGVQTYTTLGDSYTPNGWARTGGDSEGTGGEDFPEGGPTNVNSEYMGDSGDSPREDSGNDEPYDENNMDKDLYDSWRMEPYSLIQECWRHLSHYDDSLLPQHLVDVVIEHLEDVLVNILEAMFTLRSYSGGLDPVSKPRNAGNWETLLHAAELEDLPDEVIARTRRRLELLCDKYGLVDTQKMSYMKARRERDKLKPDQEKPTEKGSININVDMESVVRPGETDEEIDEDDLLQTKRRKQTEYEGDAEEEEVNLDMESFSSELFGQESKKKPYDLPSQDHQMQNNANLYQQSIPIQDVQSFYYNTSQNMPFDLSLGGNPYMGSQMYQQGLHEGGSEQSVAPSGGSREGSHEPKALQSQMIKGPVMNDQGDGSTHHITSSGTGDISSMPRLAQIQYNSPYLMQHMQPLPVPPIHSHSATHTNLPVHFQNVIDSQAQILSMHEQNMAFPTSQGHSVKQIHPDTLKKRHKGDSKINKQTQLLISALELQIDDDLRESSGTGENGESTLATTETSNSIEAGSFPNEERSKHMLSNEYH